MQRREKGQMYMYSRIVKWGGVGRERGGVGRERGGVGRERGWRGGEGEAVEGSQDLQWSKYMTVLYTTMGYTCIYTASHIPCLLPWLPATTRRLLVPVGVQTTTLAASHMLVSRRSCLLNRSAYFSRYAWIVPAETYWRSWIL